MKRLIALSAIALLATSLPAAASESAGTLPNGTPIDVTVDLPLDGTEFVATSGGVSVDVTGTASVGNGAGSATLAYVLDVSGSVNDATGVDCGGDVNRDGLTDTILDCEITAVLELNEAVAGGGIVNEVGLGVYGRLDVAADMTPGGGDDPVTAPDAGPGDVATVATSVIASTSHAGPLEFTAKHANRGYTNFSSGIAAATTIVNASSNTNNIVVFMSDGKSNSGSQTFAANLARLTATGATVHAFAVGSNASCTGGSHGTLQEIAIATSGSCVEVENPADLARLVSGLFISNLNYLELTVNAGAASVIDNGGISAALPQRGPIAVDYTTPVSGLAPGAHTMCVTAHGDDGDDVGNSGEACTTIYIYGIDLNPPSATKELETDTDHTVTATISGDAPTVGDRLVTFTITDGPNAGATGTGTTDAAGNVSWTYDNTGHGGTDTIRACFTVAEPTGQTGCDTAIAKWADTAPPLAACMPGPNPHGKRIPPAGSSSLPGPKGGQNEDGFYDLMAKDAVDPDPLVYVIDEATGHVFGPYEAGTIIKWTQAPGREPVEKKIGSTNGQAGAVTWHLTGQGDMLVYAVDASGNASDPIVCLVPPFPK